MNSGEEELENKQLPQISNSNAIGIASTNNSVLWEVLQERKPGVWYAKGIRQISDFGDYDKALYFFLKEVSYNHDHWQSHLYLAYLYTCNITSGTDVVASSSHFLRALKLSHRCHNDFLHELSYDKQTELLSFYKDNIKGEVLNSDTLEKIYIEEDNLIIAFIVASYMALPFFTPDVVAYMKAYNVQSGEESWVVYFILGREYYCSGNYVQALEHLNITIELEPEFVQAYSMRGNIKSRLEDFFGAIGDYSRAINLEQGTNHLWRHYEERANVRKRINDYYGAVEDLIVAINSCSESTNRHLYCDLACLKIIIHDYHGAIEDCTKSLALSGDYCGSMSKGFYIRGVAKGFLGDTEGAIQDYTNSIEAYPESAIAYFGRAQSYKVIGEITLCEQDMADYERLKKRNAIGNLSWGEQWHRV
ncbi:tetratricopeptide repeat protein [Pontibacter sp. SGAir0037]|uniref:tetratricopeptide repeat protein n=1 Tax=Pontibacter sp. SGAir0037 TaxID=2571030 RepID=UPI00143D5CE2|nr:tetratricopeptide repeat protein [Pontibacter sp. SGAir0037]